MEVKEEYQRFSGKWVQTSCNSDGIENPEEDYGASPVVIFTNNRFVVTSADGLLLIEGVFSINPYAKPKEVDWTDTYGEDAGKTFPAIYEISEECLSFCAANENMCRPSIFEAKMGHTLRTFRRQK